MVQSEEEGMQDNIAFTPSQYQQLLKLLSKESQAIDKDDHSKTACATGKYCLVSSTGSNWMVDNGATDHICSDLSLFTTYNDVQGEANYFTIPDGTKVLIKQVGTVHLQNDLILNDVLFVPEFKFNLISIPTICKDLNC